MSENGRKIAEIWTNFGNFGHLFMIPRVFWTCVYAICTTPVPVCAVYAPCVCTCPCTPPCTQPRDGTTLPLLDTGKIGSFSLRPGLHGPVYPGQTEGSQGSQRRPKASFGGLFWPQIGVFWRARKALFGVQKRSIRRAKSPPGFSWAGNLVPKVF